jgi:hypothetical protein
MNLTGTLSSITSISVTNSALKSCMLPSSWESADFYRVKGKVIAVYVMKTYRGRIGVPPVILSLALDESGWSASCCSCFTPGERMPGISWIGGWVGTELAWTFIGKKKILCFCQIQNPGCPSHITFAVPSVRYCWNTNSSSGNIVCGTSPVCQVPQPTVHCGN